MYVVRIVQKSSSSSFTFSSHKIKAGLVFIFYDWILNVGIFIKKRVFIETMNKNKNCHARLEKDCQARDDENRNSVGTSFERKSCLSYSERKFRIQ